MYFYINIVDIMTFFFLFRLSSGSNSSPMEQSILPEMLDERLRKHIIYKTNMIKSKALQRQCYCKQIDALLNQNLSPKCKTYTSLFILSSDYRFTQNKVCSHVIIYTINSIKILHEHWGTARKRPDFQNLKPTQQFVFVT